MRSALIVALVAVIGAGVGGARQSDASTRPSCSAVITPTAVTEHRGGGFNAAFRLRCNFELTRLRFQTSKALGQVFKHPTLERSDPGDHLSCRRSSRVLGRCAGKVGENVRVLGSFRVRRGPCSDPRLRVRFRAFGGEDCDAPATACPSIAYVARRRVGHPRGCG